jgi:very-short-patch-repair endonuclease
MKKGSCHSKEVINKMRLAHKGQVSPFKGHCHTLTSIEKMRQNHAGGREVGYHLSEETIEKMRKPKSVAHCKNIGLSKAGQHLSKKHKEKLSQNHADVSGAKHPMFGKCHSKGIKDKISRTMIRYFSRLSLAERDILTRKRFKYMHISPNKSEQKVYGFIDKYIPGKFKFTGDGSVVIGGKIPDFTNKEDKQIIEYFGDYWHRGGDLEVQNRVAYFKQCGYDAIVIREHELRDEKSLMEKIVSFQSY